MNAAPQTKRLLNNPKVPSWIGSVLFHLVALAIILLFFQSHSTLKSAPGERNALGGIVLKMQSAEGTSFVDSQNNQFGEAGKVGEKSTAPTLQESLSGEFSDLDLRKMLPSSAIGPRGDVGNGAGATSGTEIAESLQHGSRVAGLGRDVGGKVSINVFGAEGKGTKFVYVFDRSGSMNEYGGRPIRAAKAQLIQSLDPFGNFHQFNIIFYNENFNMLSPGKIPFATDVFKESAKRFVEGIVPMGGTRHLDPLIKAIRLKPDVIFFLTDGDENDALRPGQLEEIANVNSRIGAGVQINVIQFGVGEANDLPNFLKKLASQNNGQYVYVNIATIQ